MAYDVDDHNEPWMCVECVSDRPVRLAWYRRAWMWFTGPHYKPINTDAYQDAWYRENGGKR